jgi:hypothetical protein
MSKHTISLFSFLLFSCTPLAWAAPAPLDLDNTAILDVPGRADVNEFSWADSYSVGNSCYCATTFDHDIDVVVVNTRLGKMTVREVCELLGPGPGSDDRPRYNDIQCGNGPANNAGDEDDCPGRTEHGQEGCKYIGPKWNFSPFVKPAAPAPKPPSAPTRPKSPASAPAPTPRPSKAPLMQDGTRIRKNVVGDANVQTNWADSYSVGNRCYCTSTFDHDIGDTMVNTAVGTLTVKEACDRVGPGPGRFGRPVYNDIQCGNGPASDAVDEKNCPGRTEYGANGCKYVGPKWKFNTTTTTTKNAVSGTFIVFPDESGMVDVFRVRERIQQTYTNCATPCLARSQRPHGVPA